MPDPHPDEFSLHPRLAEDAIVIGTLPLCLVLLVNDARFPWLILVPRRPGICEIFQLDPADQGALIRESSLVSAALAGAFAADKMNVAALGNQVSQLHVHHIVRHVGDPAWPGPVWGTGDPVPYRNSERAERIAACLRALPRMDPGAP